MNRDILNKNFAKNSSVLDGINVYIFVDITLESLKVCKLYRDFIGNV